ncbi:MAG TPA: PfkB family carbohydrate kinase [Marmoricola sp.]
MIVVAGESLIDIVRTPAGETSEHVGGAPLTVATGLARLDVPAVLLTELGPDAHAALIRTRAQADGLEIEASAVARTATATARLDDLGAATYDFDITWTLPATELPPCDALHVGALGSLLEPGRDTVWDLVDQAYARAVPVSYDPNIRPAFVEDAEQMWRDVEALAGRSDVVKLSDQDIDALHPGADATLIARSLLGGERTSLVVLTRGPAGATAYTENAEVTVPAAPVEVVDTVGAGDAFTAAMLAVLFEQGAFGAYGAGLPDDETTLRRLLVAASSAAAISCGRRGAEPATRSELPPDWPG